MLELVEVGEIGAIADRAGIKRETLSRYRSGAETNPTLRTIEALAAALKFPIADLISEPPAENPEFTEPRSTRRRPIQSNIPIVTLEEAARAGRLPRATGRQTVNLPAAMFPGDHLVAVYHNHDLVIVDRDWMPVEIRVPGLPVAPDLGCLIDLALLVKLDSGPAILRCTSARAGEDGARFVFVEPDRPDHEHILIQKSNEPIWTAVRARVVAWLRLAPTTSAAAAARTLGIPPTLPSSVSENLDQYPTPRGPGDDNHSPR